MTTKQKALEQAIDTLRRRMKRRGVPDATRSEISAYLHELKWRLLEMEVWKDDN